MRVERALLAGVFAALSALPLAAQDRFREPESKVDVGDWSLECYLNEDRTPQACQAYHRVLMDNATRIALVTSFAVPADGAGVFYQIALPLGIDLMAGVTMTVDGDYSVKIPVTRCTLQGCLMEGRLTAAPYDALTAGKAATFTVVIPDQGVLAIPMSLIGFGEAIRRIRDAAQPAPSAEQEVAPTSPAPDVPLSDLQPNGIDPALAPVTGAGQSD